MSNTNRPLSPFMLGSTYKPQITSVLSILHRITGAALAAGTLLLAWWLFAALSGVRAFGVFQAFRESFIGQFMLFGWLFSFVYHLLNGIRHLKWDLGYGIEMKRVYRSGYLVIGGTIVITLLIWQTGAK
ncbi:MAG: succinate dehydrogenase, cytochrome b556 subunit [Alphaproteobacteria bacterium]|nr:succinate dehydrogenase, cytochrome b556 subunit [Alphaproteobacteria bacterium]